MSSILDALRKLEQEKQHDGAAPLDEQTAEDELAGAPVQASGGKRALSPALLVMVGAVLCLGLIAGTAGFTLWLGRERAGRELDARTLALADSAAAPGDGSATDTPPSPAAQPPVSDPAGALADRRPAKPQGTAPSEDQPSAPRFRVSGQGSRSIDVPSATASTQTFDPSEPLRSAAAVTTPGGERRSAGNRGGIPMVATVTPASAPEGPSGALPVPAPSPTPHTEEPPVISAAPEPPVIAQAPPPAQPAGAAQSGWEQDNGEPVVVAPPLGRSEPSRIVFSSLPRLNRTQRIQLRLPELRIMGIGPKSDDRPQGTAWINRDRVDVGDSIPGTQGRVELIAIDHENMTGVAVAVDGRNYFLRLD